MLAAAVTVALFATTRFWQGHAERTVEEGEIYFAQGHLVKMEAPLNEKMLAHATSRFSYIYENYLEPESIRPYLSIIPDKNYYLTEDGEPRALDYDALIEKIRDGNPYMEYIDITELLSLEDYYVTDSHWSQERIVDVADRIAEAMGAQPGTVEAFAADCELVQFETPFYGAYYMDGENRVGADTVCYLDSALLEACTVQAVGEEMEAAVYDLEKGKTESPYDLFLSGTAAILSIENSDAADGKKLVVFRDSFASSLVPLLIPEYQNITLIDIRYVQSAALGAYVDFSGADVLFLYSTLLLNNSMGMK
jgi:hypothetical protein